MKRQDFIDLLKSHGFSHDRYQKKNWRGQYKYDVFIKGSCWVELDNQQITVQHVQTLRTIGHEDNLIGPFYDGVMFDMESREFVR